MSHHIMLAEEEIELIQQALQASQEALQQVYTKDWLQAQIKHINTKLVSALQDSDIASQSESALTMFTGRSQRLRKASANSG